jgi:quercetin dioxygenase-like cupin family protein
MADHQFFPDLAGLLTGVPEDSILSRTFFDGGDVRAVLFSFAAGQELSEHTAAVPAVLHFLSGEATLTLGAETVEARAGSWAYMQARLPHSVKAHTPLTMLLLMLKASD